MIEFRIEPYEQCVDETIAFRNANRSILRDRAYFDWRYRDRPCPVKAHIVWGIDEQGRRIASTSIIPHEYSLAGLVHPVGVLGDISVAPEFHGRGIATQMIQALHAAPELSTLRGCLVLPNAEASRAFERAQWSNVALIQRYVLVLNVMPRLRPRFGGSAPVFWLAGAINAALALRQGRRPSRKHGCGVRVRPADFDATYDDLWRSAPRQGHALALRNRNYLAWRYAHHPQQAHQLIELRQGDALKAYAVFHSAGDALIIDDFLAADAGSGESLVAEVVAHAKSLAAPSVHVRCSISALEQVPWTSAGFVRRADTQRVMISWPASAERWYVSAGDKDV